MIGQACNDPYSIVPTRLLPLAMSHTSLYLLPTSLTPCLPNTIQCMPSSVFRSNTSKNEIFLQLKDPAYQYIPIVVESSG